MISKGFLVVFHFNTQENGTYYVFLSDDEDSLPDNDGNGNIDSEEYR